MERDGGGRVKGDARTSGLFNWRWWWSSHWPGEYWGRPDLRRMIISLVLRKSEVPLKYLHKDAKQGGKRWSSSYKRCWACNFFKWAPSSWVKVMGTWYSSGLSPIWTPWESPHFRRKSPPPTVEAKKTFALGMTCSLDLGRYLPEPLWLHNRAWLGIDWALTWHLSNSFCHTKQVFPLLYSY